MNLPIPPRYRRALLASALLLVATLLTAADFNYALQPVKVAADTYVFVGRNEYFSPRNGGNIVNTGFIVTSKGVVVIDSGPSLRYGQEMRQAIARITRQPIVRVFISHAHPDHFLGNQAFAADKLYALPSTTHSIGSDGNALAENMYRLNGDWMHGTEAVVPSHGVTAGDQDFGNHQLRLLPLHGHTAGDLAIYDRSTGVLFAGDLVFHDRAPTTPNADIGDWLTSLAALEALKPRVVVPGHGPVSRDAERSPIAQTRAYLQWLRQAMQEAAANGLDMTEVLRQPLPPAFAHLAVGHDEYQRSVTHLYPAAEQAMLAGPGQAQ